MHRALNEKQDEALKDLTTLRDKLEKAQKEASYMKRENAALVEKVQEKKDLIDHLRAKMDEVKATVEALRGRMDLLGSKKKATKEELASVKDQLQVAKDKADKWSRINDVLRAQLNSVVLERDSLSQEYTVLKSKSKATLIGSSKVKEMLAQYKVDVEIVEACLKMKTECMPRNSTRTGEVLKGLSDPEKTFRILNRTNKRLQQPHQTHNLEIDMGDVDNVNGNVRDRALPVPKAALYDWA
ncbi:protein WEAK CHLOROPLAST MOVEMENT UNDER BLUE LIGHT-like 1 [Nicotiana sylvestris]|uniref:protein WEAK CHLOROPLAST MOVEMENT UNDER BLUE LIGHT-like 1 n=1 Tax=Nicotiana sylvestris TaxID=4096 RepID=UPI00388CDCB7